MLSRLLLVFAAFLVPAAAFGQASLSAGVAFPVAPEAFGEAYSPGFSTSGSFQLPFPDLPIVPRLAAGFSAFQYDSDLVAGGGVGDGGNLSLIFVGFDAHLMRPRGLIKPYIAPFLGFTILSFEGFSEGETGASIGGAGGIAVRLPPGPHVFIEARLVHAFLDGGDLTWMPVHAGIAFDLE